MDEKLAFCLFPLLFRGPTLDPTNKLNKTKGRKSNQNKLSVLAIPTVGNGNVCVSANGDFIICRSHIYFFFSTLLSTQKKKKNQLVFFFFKNFIQYFQ